MGSSGDNPEYKGEWSAKRIDNPEYKADATFHEYTFGGLGFELWQTKAGSLFDNIIITDSWDEAKAYAEETYSATKDAEKKMKDDAAAAEAPAEEDDSAGTEEDEKEE